jgi:hypothetical protein
LWFRSESHRAGRPICPEPLLVRIPVKRSVRFPWDQNLAPSQTLTHSVRNEKGRQSGSDGFAAGEATDNNFKFQQRP